MKKNQFPTVSSKTQSVQFSHSVVSDALRSHKSQHARPPCSSPSPRVHSDSRPSSPWCHPDISSSVVPFSSCPQSLPASRSFPMSQLFAWGGQSIGVSALASLLPVNTQDWSPLGWTGWSLVLIHFQRNGYRKVRSLEETQKSSRNWRCITDTFTWTLKAKNIRTQDDRLKEGERAVLC